ncbi:hypothetical protein PF006_g16063 [Phytophthora fragariae]|uniref:Ubiquitin-like protease family profile domain-containing protein n=1 Tax=Phytophthora fragariae TaxID=53985 RepID=A0A6A3TEV3_9STRA|nr:hypothetical protein PF006_g16063 [Phytophthora fragariae]
MSNVLRFTTHFVAERIEPQYAAAISKAEAYAYESTPDDPDPMLLHGGSSIRRLSTKDWRCDSRTGAASSVQRIYYYDPLNQKGYMRAAKEVATNLKFKRLSNYDAVAQNNPIQFDQFSCGVFVYWTFMRQVVQGVTNDMSEDSLPLRRFKLFYSIPNGRFISFIKDAAATAYVLPQIMPDEDKAPVVETQRSADDDILPTQVAE